MRNKLIYAELVYLQIWISEKSKLLETKISCKIKEPVSKMIWSKKIIRNLKV